MKIEIRARFDERILLSGEYKDIRDCLEQKRGADLGGANLRDANLRDADLRGAKNYIDSHDVFKEAVRRKKVEVFSEIEWSAIAQITIHTLCWDSIRKRFGNVMGHIFEILAQDGYTEWLEYWNKIKGEN